MCSKGKIAALNHTNRSTDMGMCVNTSQKSWLKNIGSLSVLRLCEYLLPLVTFPIVVRVLGPETYGKWVYAQTVVGFYSLASGLGLMSYGPREIAAHPEKAGKLVSSILSLRVCLSLMTYAILIGSLVFLRPDNVTGLLITLLGLNLVISSLCSLNWIFTGFQRFNKMASLEVFSQIIFVGGTILFLRRSDTVWVLPVLVCAGGISAGMLGWRYLKKEGINVGLSIVPRQWWGILKFSLYYSFASFMSLIYSKADHLILSWMKGDYVLGQYGACYRLMGALMGFVLVVPSVFGFYAVSVYAKTPERFGQLLHKGLLALTAICLPIALGSFSLSHDIIALIIGREYLESVDTFRVLLLVIPLGVSSSFFAGSLLYAPGHHRKYATAVTVGAIANMLFNVLLIPSMGAMGAAVATVFAQASVTGAALYIGRQYLPKVFNRSVLHPVAAGLCMVLVLTMIAGCGLHMVVKIVIGALIYILTLWILDRRDGRELSALVFSHIQIRDLPSVAP
jgi:PST family polysaccharide transporter